MGARFGQHFLKSENLLAEVAGFAKVGADDVVLEVGSATGSMTKYFVKAKKVYAVEIDSHLFSKLTEKMKQFPNVECINSDVLSYDFPKDINKIVGNLPYEISSPITEKILKFLNKQALAGKATLAILMYQLEFAERMTAFPGLKEYSRLSVLVNYYAEAKILKKISKTAFRPAPKVESAVVELKPVGVEDDEKLFELAKILFMHKNKNVVNALINSRDHLKINDKKELKELIPKLLGKLAEKKVFYLEIDEMQEMKEKLENKKII
jgi:16S rRNA (adenine1518-N6/adenine1519-N6)-dimethyltransferase